MCSQIGGNLGQAVKKLQKDSRMKSSFAKCTAVWLAAHGFGFSANIPCMMICGVCSTEWEQPMNLAGGSWDF